MDRALGEDWEGKERKNATCSDEEGATEEREWGRRGVQEGASVRLERSRERYAWLCGSSYIEHSVCVLTLTPVSHWGTNSSYWHSAQLPLPLFTPLFPSATQVHGLFLPPIPSLIFDLNIFSVSPLHQSHITCFHSVQLLWTHYTFLSTSSFCVSWTQLRFICMNEKATIIARATIKHSVEDRRVFFTRAHSPRPLLLQSRMQRREHEQ